MAIASYKRFPFFGKYVVDKNRSLMDFGEFRMKIIRNEEQVAQIRPDGRNIKQLLTESFNNLRTSFILVEHPPNFEEKQHFHEKSFEIFFFLDEAKYKIGGKIYDVKEGDLVVFEPKDVHGAVKVDNKVRLFIMQIPPTEKDKVYVDDA